jgi:muramoyltetrapeptide carboxypeptidase
VATARWITEDRLQPALDIIHSWGFKTKVSPYVFSKNFQLAGTDQQRAAEFQNAIDDPEVKAVIIARGGYGTVRIIDRIDFRKFAKQPKWICGYSDITVLHSYLNRIGIATIHSTMPVSFIDATPEALETLRLAITGELKQISWPSLASCARIESTILGGNLSVLNSILGSNCLPAIAKCQLPTDHCMLFIEDVDEMLYHIDRMMLALKRSGALNGVQAIVAGGFTQMKDNTTEFGFTQDLPWGKRAEEILKAVADELEIPLLTKRQPGILPGP